MNLVGSIIEAEIYATGKYVSIVKIDSNIIYIPRTDKKHVRIKVIREILPGVYDAKILKEEKTEEKEEEKTEEIEE